MKINVRKLRGLVPIVTLATLAAPAANAAPLFGGWTQDTTTKLITGMVGGKVSVSEPGFLQESVTIGTD